MISKFFDASIDEFTAKIDLDYMLLGLFYPFGELISSSISAEKVFASILSIAKFFIVIDSELIDDKPFYLNCYYLMPLKDLHLLNLF